MNKTIKEHPDSYNGWTNYATWRVNLEILGDMDWYENIVFGEYKANNTITSKLAEDYARVFLSEVNYHEILEHILDEKEIEKQTENE